MQHPESSARTGVDERMVRSDEGAPVDLARALLPPRKETTMDQAIPSGLKATFLAHALISGVVGLQHLVAPRVWTDLAGMEITITVTWRVIGAAVLAFAVASWLASREDAWERVRIVVLMEIVWSILGALAIAWGILVEGAPRLEWLNVAILGFFAVVFGRFVARMRAV